MIELQHLDGRMDWLTKNAKDKWDEATLLRSLNVQSTDLQAVCAQNAALLLQAMHEALGDSFSDKELRAGYATALHTGFMLGMLTALDAVKRGELSGDDAPE